MSAFLRVPSQQEAVNRGVTMSEEQGAAAETNGDMDVEEPAAES